MDNTLWELLIEHRRRLMELSNLALDLSQHELVSELDKQVDQVTLIIDLAYQKGVL